MPLKSFLILLPFHTSWESKNMKQTISKWITRIFDWIFVFIITSPSYISKFFQEIDDYDIV